MGRERASLLPSSAVSLGRRGFIAGCAGGLLLGAFLPRPAPAAVVRRSVAATAFCGDGEAVVDQITDVAGRSPSEMFRFVPDAVCIEAGESVRFLNSRSQHTVHSVPALTPAGAETVSIVGAAVRDVVFDVPGIHGIDCARHGRYGMVMVVAVRPFDRVPQEYWAALPSLGTDRALGFERLFTEIDGGIPG